MLNLLALIIAAKLIDLGECLKAVNFCDKVEFASVQIPRFLMTTKESHQFRVESGKVLHCPSSKNVLNSSIANPTFFFHPTGYIVIPHEDYFLPDDYCISRFDNDSIEIQHCDVQCNQTHICIYKCCPPNAIVDLRANLSDTNSYCVDPGDTYWHPIFYDAHEGCGVRTMEKLPYHLRPVPFGRSNGFLVPYKHVHTNHGRLQGTRFRLMSDGHILTQYSKNEWTKITHGDFCIDGMAVKDAENNFIYTGQFHEQLFFDLAFIEHEDYPEFNEIDAMEMHDLNDTQPYPFDEPDKIIEPVEYFYITLLLVGASFLLASSALYLLTWEKHNIHAYTIFAYVTTMLFMFIFLATARILSITENSDFGGTRACKSIGIFTHFFYLSTMCWLTIINVDLWLTFRNVKPASSRRQNFTRFGFYSIFAIGCPIVIVGFAVILDSLYLNGIGDGSECVPPYILPLYGEEQCYIQKDAYWPWLYSPIAILLGCNIVTFSSTVYSLVRYRKTARNAVANNTHQKDSIILFAKLFVVAGISWIFELLSNTGSTHWSIWIIFDCYNLLQAILIFIIFALKRENVVYLYQKYPVARAFLGPAIRCCYSRSFDPERTEMTGVSYDRTSKFHFRKASTASTTAVLSSRLSIGSDNGLRRGSTASVDNKDNMRY